MDSSPAQRLMSRRLKSALPVADTLLQPQVITGVTDKLRHRRQVSKIIYDRSAKDLPELAAGDAVRMKPLAGDRTGIWRRGLCLQRVAPRSYLVEVEGALYRRNRVDLRVAEPRTPHITGVSELPPLKQAEGQLNEASQHTTSGPHAGLRDTGPPQTLDTAAPPGPPGSTVCSRYGRQIRPTSRLDL